MNATVHLLCGKTGSGKTTFARKLEQEQRAVLLSVDPWMIRLFGEHMPREVFDARLNVCMDLLYDPSARNSPVISPEMFPVFAAKFEPPRGTIETDAHAPLALLVLRQGR